MAGKDYLAVFSLPLIDVAVDAIEQLSPSQHRTEELPSLTCGYSRRVLHRYGIVVFWFLVYIPDTYYIIPLYIVLYSDKYR